jgi:penicillin-binding protein 1A
VSPYFVDYVARFVATDPAFGATEADRYAALYSGGLRIHTTLDPAAQRAAEDAVGKVLPDPADPYAGVVSIDPRTGAIVAMVGGRDYFSADDPVAKFNLAVQGRRSPGSSFKPFVLAAALLGGVKPTTVFDAPAAIDIPFGANETWHVENYEGRATGNINLVEATVNSVNVVYAELISQVGPDKVVDLAHQMGITSDLPEVPSIALGSARVSPLEMASAYATLADGGVHIPPRAVTKVTDKDGKLVWQPEELKAQVLPADVAALETAILTQVVDRGTGVGARLGRPAAGKTGTAQDYHDAWFVGYTPELATAVWVGFPQAEIPMVPPTTRQTVLGGSFPASIFQLYMSQALASTPVSQFPAAPSFDEGASAGKLASFVGQPYEEAAAALQRKGFTVVRQDRWSGEFPPGRVTGSDPAPGQPVAAGATVTLLVASSAGRPVAVPDVLGLDAGAATAKLTKAGFHATVTDEPDDDGAAAARHPGQIWKQDPAAGTDRPPGTTITVYVNP